MKTGTIFWGTLLITIGATILALQNGWIILPWEYLSKYWAALLVLWGVALLIRKTQLRGLFVALIAAIAGVVITASAANFCTYEHEGYQWRFYYDEHRNQWNEDNDCDDEDADDKNADNEDNDKKQEQQGMQQENSKVDSLHKQPADSTKKEKPIY